MMVNLAFLKKEFKEIARTYKIWVVPIIFLFFGFLSPIAVKLLPELLKATLEAQHIAFKMPPPTAVDSYLQYFKNLAQMGMLAIILLSMGLVSEEKTKGTLVLVLTKPVSRTGFVLSKFIAQTILVISSIIAGAVATYYYTLILFEAGNLSEFALAMLLYLIYSLLIITITLFLSTLLSNQVAAGGLALISVFVLSLLPSLHRIFDRYSPYALTITADKIVSKHLGFADSLWPMGVSLLLVALLLVLSCFFFNRQEL